MGVELLAKMAKSRAVRGSLLVLAAGMVIGIDMSTWLYRLIPFLQACGPSITDIDYRRGAAIIARWARTLEANRVTPVFVFDCPFTSPAKQEERLRRRAQKARRCINGQEEGDGDDGDDGDDDVIRPALINVHGPFQDAVWAALAAAGFTCVMAPAEADHQMARMCHDGDLDGIQTLDSDLLGLFCPVVFFGLNREYETQMVMLDDLHRPIELAARRPPGDRMDVDGCVSDAEGEEADDDPLDWLVDMGELWQPALLLYCCIAHSDFNKIPSIGPATAKKIVREASLEQSFADMGAGFADFLKAVAPVVHAEHARRASCSSPMSQVQVLAGMMRAYASFRRSLTFDRRRGVERPLWGGMELSEEEMAIVGRPCLDSAAAWELATGKRRRGLDLPERGDAVPNARLPHSVRVRGTMKPVRMTYDLLPPAVRPIFELDQAVVDGQRAWPCTIHKDHLILFFKCVGEPGKSDEDVSELRRDAILWLKAHRTECEDSDDEDAASGDERPKFAFTQCLLRDPLGRSALDLALSHGRVVAPELRHERNTGELALPGAESPGWIGGVDDWRPTGSACPPVCDVQAISAHYTDFYLRGEVPEDPLCMCRPMKRALDRIVRPAAC